MPKTFRGRRPRLLTVILAGGQGGRLDLLTERRAKPAVPFAGTYRLIDFPLTNCHHSGLSDVWVVEQYLPFHLNEHLANGRPWDLDRLRGGLRVMPPYQARGGSDNGDGFAQGNADALWRNREYFREFDPDLLLVLSADHVYRMDYRDIIDDHLSRPSPPALTLAATRLPAGEDATRFGNVVTDDGAVTDFAYKPDAPLSDLVTAEVFLYDARRLLDTLDELAAGRSGDADEPPLKDFGHELLPHLVESGDVRAFRHDGYWRDVGTVDSYFAAHREFLRPDPPLTLDAPEWPVLTFGRPRGAARVERAGRVDDSLLSPGCRVAGRVTRSVLGPGVVVEEGAEVTDAVLLEDVRVCSGAVVRRAIVDECTTVGSDARVGGDAADAPLVLVAAGASVPAGHVVPAGERFRGI